MLIPKKTNKKDIKYILNHLRAEDLAEVKSAHGSNWKKVVLNDFFKHKVTIGVDKVTGEAVCMGGVCHLINDPDNVGVVLMLSTDKIKNHRFSAIKGLKREIEKYEKSYFMLYNVIYHTNHLAKNWLKKLGFKFDISRPVGYPIPKGFEFFYKIRERKGLL